MPNQFKALCLTPLSALIVALGIAPANAIPGQNVSSFLKWVKSNPQLPAVKYDNQFPSYEGYNGANYHGRKDNLYFHARATSRQGTITIESVVISDDSSIKFSRHNPKAIKIIRGIYGSKIANDFSSSQYFVEVDEYSFLRGKQYGYAVSQVENETGTNFEIFLLKDLQYIIDLTRSCHASKHQATCNR